MQNPGLGARAGGFEQKETKATKKAKSLLVEFEVHDDESGISDSSRARENLAAQRRDFVAVVVRPR